ncbi:hypothetical protein PUN28_002393 [Cardiocondyla obscurior]|uniref:Uncharacterized protein n=1 Tax=Cardiocondyla obscurior TaxID=286306 RepID=A0AAW2GU79_9HYME
MVQPLHKKSVITIPIFGDRNNYVDPHQDVIHMHAYTHSRIHMHIYTVLYTLKFAQICVLWPFLYIFFFFSFHIFSLTPTHFLMHFTFVSFYTILFLLKKESAPTYTFESTLTHYQNTQSTQKKNPFVSRPDRRDNEQFCIIFSERYA